ncbi:phospho-acceptor domain-containing protein [Novosphingobium sp. PhB165]|uniref:hybrid sensor histidine kinase/response regulator n=1 Tax=Novosphingobium sp. PhB165 TaxID=2485105 RepID=UPI0010535F50|nr:hybrid sensor histidine kinase/response regulator [Novosphingobium sp. PhB165]TCM14397.1 phospho-acceptor domain-containing protein [Novosphingobium sp. PhB165]
MTPPVKFLLVDDLDENLIALAALLKRDGLVLLTARSADEALELLLEHEVALAFLDVQMPEVDGFELAEFMRGSERTRHIPIIFVTAGSADKQRRFRGYEAGAVDFIQKPIEADILRSKANVFFELHRQRQLVAAQRDELKAASQALQEVDRRKDEFLAVLGHELRNPLAALSSGLQLLQRRSADESVTIRESMELQIFHLSRLIEDLLDTARISEGKISLQKERIELQTILRSAIQGCRNNLESAGHRFTTDIPAEPVWLEADHTRLAQVVANLLNNAGKYTPKGGEISLRARATADYVEIEVADNGVGIPADMQSRIFQIFVQVPDHRQHAAGGLGVGLALVHQLLALHGGTITVASGGAGKGSVFTARIPRGTADRALA